jgi:thymidylate synthase (FAD)
MSYNVEIKLLAITPDSEKLLERAGRICYASEDKLGDNPAWLSTRIKQGHESLIEHATATFYIKASRALTHELVRHRVASYSQRSQRYVKEIEEDYITPIELSEETAPAAAAEFRRAMSAAWDSYRKLLDTGVKPEIARYVLPNACASDIICTWNFREIRHIIKLRSAPAALPEFRFIAEKIKEIMKEQAPQVFGDL